MKKKLLAILLTALLVCNIMVVTAAAEESHTMDENKNIMTVFYVSPNGDDGNDGLTESTPFASLQKARDEVAKINDNMTGDIVVYLMDGTWEQDETLTFGKDDSGTNGYYVRYEAAPGTKPMLSGGTKLENAWVLHDGDLNIYKIPLERDVKLRALYVNGKRSYMASTGDPVPARGVWGNYRVGELRDVDGFDWTEIYNENFEGKSLGSFDEDEYIKKWAFSGDVHNCVLNIVSEDEESNKAIQLASTGTGNFGFELPEVTYKNAIISYRFKAKADHEFTHEWEALHMHGVNKQLSPTPSDARWAGIKFAPHLEQTYYQTGHAGVGTVPQNVTAFVAQPEKWYQIKMFISQYGDYYTKIWEDGKEEPGNWSRFESYSDDKGADLFFRIYTYKHQNPTKVNMMLDDLCILSGTPKPDGSNGDGETLPHWAWDTGVKADGILYDQSAFPVITRNISDVEIENQQIWNKNIVCVREMEAGVDNKWILKLQQPYGAIAQTPGWNCGISGSGNHIIWNAYELLDQPGEFYFDRTEKMLYYIPREGEDLSTAEVVVPRLETVLRFRGTPVASGDMTSAGEKTITGQAKNIIFKGISVAHSDWNLYKVDNSYGKTTVQAGTVFTAFATDNWHYDIYRNVDIIPGAVEMEFAHNIRFLDGKVKLTGAEGIVMSNDVDGCEVTGNFIYQTAGGGVTVGHPQHVYENDSLEPEVYVVREGRVSTGEIIGATVDKEKYQNGTDRVPRNVKISNNLLLENCRLFPSHCPITSFYTQNMEVSNNHIRDAAYSGMSIGWGWGCFDGTDKNFTDWGTINSLDGSMLPGIPTEVCRENKIVNNRVDNVMTILHDGGLIYTLGKQDDTEVTGNFLQNSKVHGLYTDEGSAYFKPMVNNVLKDIEEAVIFAANYGRKHDLHFDNNYSDSNYVWVTNENKTNLTYANFHHIPDSMWPKEASDIIQNAGLTAEYRIKFESVLSQLYGGIQDIILPENAKLNTGEKLTLNAWLDADDEIWLAPSGTTTFEEGPTMVKGQGNAVEMSVPQQSGDYHLYAKTDGVISAESNAIVQVVTDTVLPTVTSVTPGGDGVPTSGIITIVFSEDIGTVGTVKLNDGEPLSLVQDPEDKTKFTAYYNDLEPNAEYTIHISEFKDVAGNTMDPDDSHSFTTEEGERIPSKSFIITPIGGLVKEGGIKATASISLNPEAEEHSGTEAIVFQLKNGDIPVSIIALEKNIAETEQITAFFNVDPEAGDYTVEVYVFDIFDSSQIAPIILADRVIIE